MNPSRARLQTVPAYCCELNKAFVTRIIKMWAFFKYIDFKTTVIFHLYYIVYHSDCLFLKLKREGRLK
ncbi:hypothetical protein FLACHUCJ7_00914 [Flavobacterium chungangense]|uniref:Uncharacterized protein n=1 Tax=Flavobacterium chungangense TaxID=554283 RepID=A0A6V6YSH1_9FLAO|nr:hypothetical protein FLACHUCJ7_00914 [Flavobacterium chungangense]